MEIQRPATPRELSVALGSVVSGRSLGLPDALAIEVAPYWLFWHPSLTGDQMARSSPGEAAIRHFTVSLGTVTRPLPGDPDGLEVTDLALGLRTRWLDGRPRATCWAAVESDAAAIAARQGGALAAEAGAIQARHPLRPVPPGASDAERQAIESGNAAAAAAIATELEQVRVREAEREAAARAALGERARQCVEASAARRGLVGDAALAGSMRFPAGQLEDGDWLTAGGWITLSAQGERHDLLALARALADHGTGDASLVADLGLRYIHVRGRYALSAEAIYRRLGADVPDQDLVRVDVAADMRLHGEVWFTATFARDFAAADAGRVLTLASLKWGLGGPAVALPPP